MEGPTVIRFVEKHGGLGHFLAFVNCKTSIEMNIAMKTPAISNHRLTFGLRTMSCSSQSKGLAERQGKNETLYRLRSASVPDCFLIGILRYAVWPFESKVPAPRKWTSSGRTLVTEIILVQPFSKPQSVSSRS
jgi:hypothetical protein